jgi:LacI family transcriptional regulator
LNIINAIIDEAEKEYLVIILQSNETLALEKNKWNYLLTKG